MMKVCFFLLRVVDFCWGRMCLFWGVALVLNGRFMDSEVAEFQDMI